MKIVITRFRWWLWNRLAEIFPKWSWDYVDRICPNNKDLDMLDALDRGGK